MRTETIKIELTEGERRALNRYAKQDMRQPEQFIMWLLKTEFERRRSQLSKAQNQPQKEAEY